MTMDIATLGIRIDATEARLAAIELEKLSTAGGKTAQSMSAVEKSMQGLTGLFAGLGLGALAKSVLDTNREMESLRASLKSVMGSAQGAQGAFNSILTFAKDTPYEIKGLTQTFVMLQNMGIKPTHQVMQSLTDQASKLGGSQETLTSIAMQLGQAHSKGKLQMEDMVVLMERGVPVMKLLSDVTGKNTAELADMSAKGTITVDMIDKLIVKMGEAAAGSNAIAMETLNGKISSLSDAWHSFEDTLLNDKSEGLIKTVVTNWTEWLDYFRESIAGVGKEFLALEEINNKIVGSKAKISAMSQGGVSGAAWQAVGALTGNSIEGEKNRLNDLLKQREQVIKSTHDAVVAKNQEAAATDKMLNSSKQESALTQQTLQDKKEQEKAAKAAARAEASLAKSFEDAVTSLNLHNIELSKTPRELEEATLASKGYTKAMIAQAMALYDAGVALEQKKKLNQDEKSEMDSLIDRYNKATLSARDYYATTLTTTGTDGQKIPIPAQDKAPILAQFDKTTGAEAAKKAQEDAKTTLDAYNKSLDDAKTKTQDLGGITTAIFDGALGGISLMTGALTTMTDSLAENSKAMAELNKNQLLNNSISDPEKKAANIKKYAKEEASINAKNVQDQMTGTRQIAGAASKMFAEKSAGAKAFHAIEVGIAAAQLAMRAKDMAMSAVATVKNIAEGASKLFAQSGWLGFAGVAAMLALMAGLGAMASGSGGGSSTPPPTDTGTGTVLGDSTAVSESISKTNDLLKNIHASEYVELRGINRGVNNLQAGITKTVDNLFQKGGMSTFQVDKPHQLESIAMTLLTGGLVGLVLNKLPVIGSIMSGISNFLFGGKVTQSIVAQGIGTNKTSLSDVINGGNVKAYQFADIKTHTSGGLFTSSSDSYSTQTQKVSKNVQESLNSIFSSIGKTMLSVGKTLGDSIGKDLGKVVLDASIPAMRINILGLNGEKAAAKVNGVISATLDKMSTKMFGDIVGKYQQLGEGMLQTTIRIVSEIAIVKDALAQSGLKLLKDDVIGVSDAIVQAAGGLEEFQKRFEDYYDKFHTDAEKQARLQTGLVDKMKEVTLVLPETRDGYRQLVEGLDLSNQLDKDRYNLLLELAGAADTYYSALEKGAANAQKILDQKRSLEIQIMELSGNAIGALTAKRAAELATIDSSLQFSQQAVWALQDANQKVADAVSAVSKQISIMSALANKLRSALNSTSTNSNAVTLSDRKSAQAVLTSALAIAKAGGSITNLSGMDKALADIAKPSENLYSSFTEYAKAQAEANSTISQLADYADAQVNYAQQQIDAINGTTSAVNSLQGALAALSSAIAARDALQADILAAQIAQTKADKAKADADAAAAALLSAATKAATDKSAYDVAQKLYDTVSTLPDASKKLSVLKGQYTDLVGYANELGITVTEKTSKTLSGLTDQYNALGVEVAAAALKSAMTLQSVSVMSNMVLVLLKEANAQAQANLTTALALLAAAQGKVTDPKLNDPLKPKIPGFASGGVHDGGWRMVGENGPELEKTGSSKIFSNQQSKSLVDNTELIAEVKALREEVRAGQAVIANNTKATTKILRDVTQNGTSISTVAA